VCPLVGFFPLVDLWYGNELVRYEIKAKKGYEKGKKGIANKEKR
jgi:hypothetical protein